MDRSSKKMLSIRLRYFLLAISCVHLSLAILFLPYTIVTHVIILKTANEQEFNNLFSELLPKLLIFMILSGGEMLISSTLGIIGAALSLKPLKRIISIRFLKAQLLFALANFAGKLMVVCYFVYQVYDIVTQLYRIEKQGNTPKVSGPALTDTTTTSSNTNENKMAEDQLIAMRLVCEIHRIAFIYLGPLLIGFVLEMVQSSIALLVNRNFRRKRKNKPDLNSKNNTKNKNSKSNLANRSNNNTCNVSNHKSILNKNINIDDISSSESNNEIESFVRKQKFSNTILYKNEEKPLKDITFEKKNQTPKGKLSPLSKQEKDYLYNKLMHEYTSTDTEGNSRASSPNTLRKNALKEKSIEEKFRDKIIEEMGEIRHEGKNHSAKIGLMSPNMKKSDPSAQIIAARKALKSINIQRSAPPVPILRNNRMEMRNNEYGTNSDDNMHSDDDENQDKRKLGPIKIPRSATSGPILKNNRMEMANNEYGANSDDNMHSDDDDENQDKRKLGPIKTPRSAPSGLILKNEMQMRNNIKERRSGVKFNKSWDNKTLSESNSPINFD